MRAGVMSGRLFVLLSLLGLSWACPLPGPYCPYGACEPITGLQTGERCFVSTNCLSDYCNKPDLDSYGYCSILNCENNDDCVNHEPGDTREMCCVEKGTTPTQILCIKIPQGRRCYTPGSLCGLPCTDDPDRCNEAYPCMSSPPEHPEAVCSHVCYNDDSCGDCQLPEDPNLRMRCVLLADESRYCLPAE